MKTIHIQKAASLITKDKPVEDVTIIIDDIGGLPDNLISIHAVRLHYKEEAKKLYEALRNSLPQGIIEPLIIEFMKNQISLYKGTMERTKELEATNDEGK